MRHETRAAAWGYSVLLFWRSAAAMRHSFNCERIAAAHAFTRPVSRAAPPA